MVDNFVSYKCSFQTILLPEAGNNFTNVDASKIVVIQKISGDLEVITDPGWKWRGMGKITSYSRRDQFSFSSSLDQGKAIDESIQTRFNDGGHVLSNLFHSAERDDAVYAFFRRRDYRTGTLSGAWLIVRV